MNFFIRAISCKDGDPSSTRICLLAVVLTLLAFVWGIIGVFIFTGSIPDIPAGTGLFLGGILGIVSALKGAQNKTEQ